MEKHIMAEQFLYEQLDTLSQWGSIKQKTPQGMTDNLNTSFDLRPYQIDAFSRFFYCYENEFPNKTWPLHFLFNMATGSGKTLIMAGLILYLYEKGYRNFLFFVNSTNIIEKTKDNFLNQTSIKYLFAETLIFDGKRVRITQVENFEAVNQNDINICFTTIQQLHNDLNNEKENALTFVDFRQHKIILLADEAHHMNVRTKSQKALFESWENTVERILTQNEDNVLLEFTATHDYADPAMVEKYRNKIIIRYDLLHFRNDHFSKDVVIIQSDFDQRERILQALLLNQYKQEVAAKYRINLKPVILFKAQRTIAQSQKVETDFRALIDTLTEKEIAAIRRSNIPLVQRAFSFFNSNGINDEQLAARLKRGFSPDYCLSVNGKEDKKKYQILVNTLEDKSNHIRAIFTVKMLNEGWDVLNLFDIVRCYETRDTGRKTIGTTTMSEAQLIGRGARYFPFVLPTSNNRFRRKFDDDLTNELRVLEELHYHSINDSRYISEIRQALIEQGMLDEREITRQLKLKEAFKQTDFYKFGIIWLNKRSPKSYRGIKSFADLGVKKRNYTHMIATGQGGVTVAFENQNGRVVREEARWDIKVSEIASNIIQTAVDRNPFFIFSTLKNYFPDLTSMRTFNTNFNYLGGLAITFQGNLYGLENNRTEKLRAVQGLLVQIESEIRANVTEYEGSREFHRKHLHDIFTDKVMKFDTNNPRAAENPQFEFFVSTKEWFTANNLYGTSEEEAFVRMLDRKMDDLVKQYEDVYLLRNEGHFSIYAFQDGRTFQPDFALFLRQKDGEMLIYQLFIEPKGKHLKEHDKWKKIFLQEIKDEFASRTLAFESDAYRLVGVPFYNNENENEFWLTLAGALS